jgi:hypothetical protein
LSVCLLVTNNFALASSASISASATASAPSFSHTNPDGFSCPAKLTTTTITYNGQANTEDSSDCMHDPIATITFNSTVERIFVKKFPTDGSWSGEPGKLPVNISSLRFD